MKTNLNRPFLKREDIAQQRNFQDLLLNYKLHNKINGKDSSGSWRFFRSAKFIGIAASVIVVTVFFYSRNESAKAFIHPPIAGVDIPFAGFAVDSQRDTTLAYPTGSTLNIPAGTFMNKKGVIVSGKVNLRYREFHKTSEIFASGIPMAYDSAGTQYTFQSAGMMEIEAFQNGEKLFMNPQKKIDVSLASNETENKFNVYRLDTIQKRWVYKAVSNSKDMEEQLTQRSDSSKDTVASFAITPLQRATKELKRLEASKPIVPERATKNRYRFKLDVDSSEFPEIAIYQNILFEIGEENKNFDTSSYHVTWEDVKLKENNKGKNYELDLSTRDRKSAYVVYPVFEGQDYDKAMKAYSQKYAEYQVKLANKVQEEKRLQEETRKQMELIAEQEKQAQADFEKRQKLADNIMQNQIANQVANSRMQAVAGVDYGSVRQQFQIDGFGIWNTDSPYRYAYAVNLRPNFVDESGNSLKIQEAYLVDKGKNILFTHYSPFDNFRFDPDAKNILFAVLSDNRVAVFQAKKFESINQTSGNYTFEMEVLDKKCQSVTDIEQLIGI